MNDSLPTVLEQISNGVDRGLSFAFGVVAPSALVLEKLATRLEATPDDFTRKFGSLVRTFNRPFITARTYLEQAIDPGIADHVVHESIAFGSTVSFVVAVAGAACVLYK